MYDKIKKWYEFDLWTAAMVRQSVTKGLITQEQADEIIGVSDDEKTESGLLTED